MTLIVGILCKDGVVMASDSAATFATSGRPTIGQQAMRKLVRVNDHILLSGTGAVGISQLIADELDTLWSKKALSSLPTPEAMMDKVGKAILQRTGSYLQSAQVQKQLTGDASQSLCKSLVAMPHERRACLFQFDFNGAPERATKDLPFVALGSGQPIADPFLAFLRRLWWMEEEPTLAEGRLAAVWTIDHVTRTRRTAVVVVRPTPWKWVQ